MKAKCHNCGREYATARANAGVPVECRSCHALNDGAGGPPPPQESASRRLAEVKERHTGAPKKLAGEAFSVGGGSKPVDPRTIAAEELRAELAQAQAEASRPAAQRVALLNRAVMMMGVAAALIAVIGIGGLFLLRYMESSPVAGGRDWTSTQLAVPQLVNSMGSGTGFVVEDHEQLWLVTSYLNVEGSDETTLLFRDPKSGAELFRLPGLRAADFRVHSRFLESIDAVDDGRVFDIAVAPINVYRPQLERIGVKPLQIAPSTSLHGGSRVIAMGHAATDAFEFGSDKDEAAKGVSVHSVFDGVVSNVHAEDGKPTLIQTSVNFVGGCQGGPLVLEDTGQVVGVDRWAEADANGSSKAGMRFAIAADQVPGIIGTGLPLGMVKTELAKSAQDAGPKLADGEYEEQGWKTFGQLSAMVDDLKKDGWEMQDNRVYVTDAKGSFEAPYKVRGPHAVEVAVLVLPKTRCIDVDIGKISIQGLTGIGSDLDTAHGALAAVALENPTTHELLQLNAGVEIKIPVASYFLQKPIAARFVVVVLERAPKGGTNPPPSGGQGGGGQGGGAGNGGGSPGGAQPPSGGGVNPNPLPPPPKAPPPEKGGIASVVELQSKMAERVFASSLIGFRDFDLKFLTNKSEQEEFDALFETFVKPLPSDNPFHFILDASLNGSFQSPDGANQSRPLFGVLLRNVPEGARVGVFLEIADAWKKYLPVSGNGLVSKAGDIELGPSMPAEFGRVDAVLGGYRVPLELPWNFDEIRKLDNAVDITYSLRVKYSDKTEQVISGHLRVNPPAEIEAAYPFGIGFAAAVDETHPWVKRVLEDIAHDPKVMDAGMLLAGGGSPDDQMAVESIYLVWRDLVLRGMKYQNLTGADVGAQRCRLVHESLSATNANCVDGAVLLASFMEAMGLNSYLVLVPGHALVMCVLPSGKLLFVETTDLGRHVAKDPTTSCDESFARLRSRKGFAKELSINSFELACQDGENKCDEAFKLAQPLAEEFETLRGKPESGLTTAEHKRLIELCHELENHITLIPVSRARANGIRPIGVPSNLDAKFRIPPRRSN